MRTTTDEQINEAAAALTETRAAEAAAKALRIEAEDELIRLIGLKPEGATTEKTDRFKVTTTGKISRRINGEIYETLLREHPELREADAVRQKVELNLSNLRKLQAESPDLYAVLSRAITAQPAKPTVKIEEITQ